MMQEGTDAEKKYHKSGYTKVTYNTKETKHIFLRVIGESECLF